MGSRMKRKGLLLGKSQMQGEPSESVAWVWIKRVGATLAILTALIAVFLHLVRSELESGLSPIRVDLATQGTKIDALEKQVGKLSDQVRGIPASILRGLTPEPRTLGRVSPAELEQSFNQVSSFVQAALRKQVPTSQSDLTEVEERLKEVLNSKLLPDSARTSGVSSLIHVSAYQSLNSQLAAGRRPNVFIGAYVERAKEAIKFDSPETAASIVVIDSTFKATRQDITGVKWFNVKFVDCTITYNGGDLYLSDVTFQNCRFEFGRDARSRHVYEFLERLSSRPKTLLVTRDFSSVRPLG